MSSFSGSESPSEILFELFCIAINIINYSFEFGFYISHHSSEKLVKTLLLLFFVFPGNFSTNLRELA